jgi:hypothetical protein
LELELFVNVQQHPANVEEPQHDLSGGTDQAC